MKRLDKIQVPTKILNFTNDESNNPKRLPLAELLSGWLEQTRDFTISEEEQDIYEWVLDSKVNFTVFKMLYNADLEEYSLYTKMREDSLKLKSSECPPRIQITAVRWKQYGYGLDSALTSWIVLSNFKETFAWLLQSEENFLMFLGLFPDVTPHTTYLDMAVEISNMLSRGCDVGPAIQSALERVFWKLQAGREL